MAVATSLTGRTIARRAFFTPTPSTEQNSSKNSRSTSLRKPISRGVIRPCIGLPSRYSIVCRLISWFSSLCNCRRVNSGISTSYSNGVDLQRQRVVVQGDQLAGDFGNQGVVSCGQDCKRRVSNADSTVAGPLASACCLRLPLSVCPSR